MRKNGINHGIFPLIRQVLVEHPNSIRRDLETVRPRHRRIGRLEPVVREPVAVLLLTTLLGWSVRGRGFWNFRRRILDGSVAEIGSRRRSRILEVVAGARGWVEPRNGIG